MPRPETIDRLVTELDASQNPLTDEERAEVERWRKGHALAYVVNSPGWDVVREMLQSYVTKEIDRLLSIDPGNKDEVMAAHAVAFSANRIYTIFMEDVQNCLDTTHTPSVVRERLSKMSPVPPESLAGSLPR